MSALKVKDGGPAFPQPNHIVETETQGRQEARSWMQDSGMSLRDWFAGMALQGMLKSGIVESSIPALSKAIGRDAEWRQEMIVAVAKSAYDIADAAIAERDKQTA